MDFSRLHSSIDTDRLAQATIALVGVGGGRDLACNLVRSGLRKIKLFDPQMIEAVNVARQGHTMQDVGLAKVAATAAELKRINPDVEVETYTVDFTAIPDDELDVLLDGVNLLIAATDRFAAQARGNEVALRLGIPAVWIGLYAGGMGGEIIFWHPQIISCYRCLCAVRYQAHNEALAEGRTLDPASDGATIFDVNLVDSIAGQVAIGLLTRGSDTRCGRLIEELGDRNFIQITLDPHFEFNGRDIIREQLGVPAEQQTYFTWNAIVRSDPDRGMLYCPDCNRYRGSSFTKSDGTKEMRWFPLECMH